MIPSPTAWGSAAGTGTTGPFAIPFPLYNQTHLTVLQVLAGMLTIPALGTAYTFTSWSPDNKGQVAAPAITFASAVPGGAVLVFLLMLPGTQLTAYTSGPYSPGAEEATDDLITQLCNMLMERVAKSVRAPDQEYSGNGVNLTLPPIAIRSSLVLGFDGLGNVAMYAGTGNGIPPITGYAFAALPAMTIFAIAMCTDGPIAAYNTVLGKWVKLGMVDP